ncbi:23S rRNA (uracil(1939)-C(5))-methyltransferase RlmD [Mycoplasmopsis sturni]|uniref:23S rRNA (uracil(1939)-C(5))-methyltransferase RlmD n=1 Tax=Mycoplasmopsis sturni TaxID=39047 RepID=UPI000568EAAA|nr:23S rRNA (uracil(1939)-C(5))-methyltransferase RlmD [Mycoplasmopsis sturni]
MSQLKIGDKHQVECHNISFEGLGIVLINEKRFFVPNLLPNEVAIVEITHIHSKYGYAKTVKLLEISKDRINLDYTNSACFLNWEYQKQLEFKNNYLQNLFSFNLPIKPQIIHPIIYNKNNLHYRNKVKIPLFIQNNKLSMGEYLFKSRKIVNNKNQSIINERLYHSIEKIINIINEFYNGKKEKLFFFKEIIARINKLNQIQVVFQIHNDFDLPKKLIQKLINQNIVQIWQLKKDYRLIFQSTNFSMQLNDKNFLVDPENFFQVNTEMFEQIINHLNSVINTSKPLIDAFCGVGVFSQILGVHNSKIGVEINKKSIELAKTNAEKNKIKATKYYAGKVEDVIEKLKLQQSASIILDPPRAGLDQKIINWIGKQQIEDIYYLSCDPRTLTRDLKHFLSMGFKIESIQPFDMFPHTHHIETLVVIKK